MKSTTEYIEESIRLEKHGFPVRQLVISRFNEISQVIREAGNDAPDELIREANYYIRETEYFVKKQDDE